MGVKMSKKQSWNLIAVFLILIFGFALATILGPDRERSELENRTLAQKPKVSLESIIDGSFESGYEDYLTDQFIFRDTWVTMKTNIDRMLGENKINDVYFADDHYLIEAHTNTFTADRAQTNIQLLSSFMNKISREYDSQHATVMIVPNAVDILKDKLPAFASPYNEEDYIKEISASLPDGIFYNTSSVLAEHADEDIYYRTDHHWKTLGAFYAFRGWAQKAGLGEVRADDYTVETVSEDFSGTVAARVGIGNIKDSIQIYHPKDEPELVLTYNNSDDVRHTMYQESQLDTHDQYGVFFGGNTGLIEIKKEAGEEAASSGRATPDSGTGRRILVIKDSYANCFIPFLTDHFDETDVVDLRYYVNSLSDLMEQKKYTDVLVLYNAAGFAEEANLGKLGT